MDENNLIETACGLIEDALEKGARMLNPPPQTDRRACREFRLVAARVLQVLKSDPDIGVETRTTPAGGMLLAVRR